MAITAGFVAVGSMACGPNTSGFGTATGSTPEASATDTNDTAATGSTGPATVPTGDDGASGTTTLEPSTTTGADETAEGSSSEESTTGPPADPCDPAPTVMLEVGAADAMRNAEMMLGSVPGVGAYAYSESELAGTASFQFQVQCPGEYYAWAYVHDPSTGIGSQGVRGDPDSFRVAFNANSFVNWLYGCELSDISKSGSTWRWLRAMDNEFCLSPSTVSVTLEPGTHLFHMTNRESGDHQVDGQDIGDVAAVARVLITNDPAFSP